jgi:hypothetical protein
MDLYVAITLLHAALLHFWHREWQAVQQYAERTMLLSNEQGFAHWVALSTLVRGWALAAQGYGDEGIAQMRQGIVQYRATGAVVGEVQQKGLTPEGIFSRPSLWPVASRPSPGSCGLP